MDYEIVDVRERHLPQLEAMERECFSLPWTLEQLRGDMKDDRHEFLAAIDGEDRVLGYVGMMYVLDEGYISNVAVRPQLRRQGLGDRLILALREKARELDLAFLTLEVRESNAPAIALYGKHGFVPVGLRRGYYDKPKEDALLMTLFLKRG